MNINNVGAGVGMAVGPESIVGQNPHRWNVSYQKYLGAWIRNDLSFGGIHLMHRVKFFYIYLDQIVNCAEYQFGYPVRDNLKKEHYKITWHDPEAQYEIEYEDFDYDIIQPGISSFADNLTNEIWPLLRSLWRVRGGFDIEIDFNPEIDKKEFGTTYGPPEMFMGEYRFSIDHDGNWTADFAYDFEQVENYLDTRDKDDPVYGAFFPQDYSDYESNAAKRAKRLAKPSWGMGTRSEEDWNALMSEAITLNREIDFTFYYEYKGSGKWKRDSHNVSVSDSTDSEHLAANKNIIHTVEVK
jgi:hypothetical protein